MRALRSSSAGRSSSIRAVARALSASFVLLGILRLPWLRFRLAGLLVELVQDALGQGRGVRIRIVLRRPHHLYRLRIVLDVAQDADRFEAHLRVGILERRSERLGAEILGTIAERLDH